MHSAHVCRLHYHFVCAQYNLLFLVILTFSKSPVSPLVYKYLFFEKLHFQAANVFLKGYIH